MSATLVNLDRVEVTIEPGDRVVLATDGVTDNLTNGELVDIVRRAASPDEAAAQLHTRIATEPAAGRRSAPLAGRFRRDDQTAIFRFFSLAGSPATPTDTSLPQ